MGAFQKRLLGTYAIINSGAWFLTLMMRENGIPREIRELYEFLCFVRGALTYPPLTVGALYLIYSTVRLLSSMEWHSEPVRDDAEADWQFAASKREYNQIKAQDLEDERAKELQKQKSAQAIRDFEAEQKKKKEIEARKTRSAADATKSALEDF